MKKLLFCCLLFVCGVLCAGDELYRKYPAPTPARRVAEKLAPSVFVPLRRDKSLRWAQGGVATVVYWHFPVHPVLHSSLSDGGSPNSVLI